MPIVRIIKNNCELGFIQHRWRWTQYSHDPALVRLGSQTQRLRRIFYFIRYNLNFTIFTFNLIILILTFSGGDFHTVILNYSLFNIQNSKLSKRCGWGFLENLGLSLSFLKHLLHFLDIFRLYSLHLLYV